MKRIIASLLLCVLAIIAMGERPIATLKAQYTSWHGYIDENNKKYYKEDKFILQISSRSSYFYDPQTFFVDSLNNDPVGSAIRDQALHEAFMQTRDTGGNPFDIVRGKGLMAERRYKCQKDFKSNSITVWDTSGADTYQYVVDMNDLSWELCDSTEIVLDYECTLATADYHGRKWKAWFATDIPVQDGP